MSEENKPVEKLTPKEKKFVEYYLGEAHFNATRAVELAGYKGSKNVLGVTAYRMLRKPKIKAEIDDVLSAMTMPGNVVLARLTEYAEGNVEDVCDDKGNFSFELAKKRRKTHLLKKIKVKRTIREKKTEVADSMRAFLGEDEIEDLESEVEILHEEIEFELYSAHEATRDLAKHHKLFTENVNLTGDLNHNHSIDPETIKTINQAYDDAGED